MSHYRDPIPLNAIPTGGLGRFVVDDDVAVCVVRRGDTLVVFRDVCPHMGAPISGGTLCNDGASIRCPWHGYEFRCVDGAFAKNPNEEIFAPFHGKYQSWVPEAPRYRLQKLEVDSDGIQLRVRRPERA